MVNYRLVYFNARGRGEVSRMLFALAGEKYEDTRMERDAWNAVKKDSVFGQLPMLVVDGEVLCQSKAIERYLARKFGLAGKTEMDQARVDMVMECMEDGVKPLASFFTEQDEAKKATLKKKWEDEDLPVFMEKLEKMLTKNKGGDGYFVGGALTVADLEVVQLCTMPSLAGVDIKLAKYPKLKAHKARVEDTPKIKQWIANRPKTDF